MVTQDKNCFRSQGGAVIEPAGKGSVVFYAAINYSDMPYNAISGARESKIKTPPSNTFNKYYFFD